MYALCVLAYECGATAYPQIGSFDIVLFDHKTFFSLPGTPFYRSVLVPATLQVRVAVQEWHNRVHLFEGDAHQQIQTYTEAVKTVDPNQAVGKPHTLWCAFAHFYERHGDIDNARAVFDKATQVWPDASELQT